MARRSLVLASLVLLVACSGPPAPAPDAGVDAGSLDAGSLDAGALEDASGADASAEDASIADAGTDAGPADAGPPVEGTIMGTCGVIDDELFDPSPFFFENEITFPVRLTEPDLVHFTDGARELLSLGTVGGSSIYSEAMAFEVLARCEGAELVAGEGDVEYAVEPPLARTDILVDIDGELVGVSVVRAMSFPRDAAYPTSEAERILTNKLTDIHDSTASVADSHRWVKQILAVMAYSEMHAEQIRAVWPTLSAEVRGDTILVLTVTHGEDAFIYENEL